MTDDRDNRNETQGSDQASFSSPPTPESPAHTLESVKDLLRTPTEGQDLRKSFFLPLELYDGDDEG